MLAVVSADSSLPLALPLRTDFPFSPFSFQLKYHLCQVDGKIHLPHSSLLSQPVYFLRNTCFNHNNLIFTCVYGVYLHQNVSSTRAGTLSLES